MRVLVTGGKGFVGSALAHALVAQGHDIVCLDLKTSPGRLGDIADRVVFEGGGLGNVDRVERIIRTYEVDRVAHMVFSPLSEVAAGFRDELETMVLGTVDVFEAAARTGLERVIFPSSIHVYGPQWLHGEVTLSEAAPALATTVYGVGKQLAEAAARRYNSDGRTAVVSLRLPAVYGPGADIGARGVNVPAVAAGRGEPAAVPYPSDDRVCVAHVGDVAACLGTALAIEGLSREIYNIGGTTLSYGAIVAMVKELVPDLPVTFTDGEHIDLPYLIDDSAARRELGLCHRPVEAGMREVVEHSRVERARRREQRIRVQRRRSHGIDG